MSDFREALLEVMEGDAKYKSDAKSLVKNELEDFVFLMAIIIWFEILTAMNVVSKLLQSKDMLVDDAMEKMKGLISCFEEYRENGFQNALNSAKEATIELHINPEFPQRRIIRRKKHFDENFNTPSVELFGEESFRVNYFLYLVDQAIVSLHKRFEQYQEFENFFGFLFSSQKLRSLDDACLKSCCSRLEGALQHNEHSDIDGNELCVELKLLRELLNGEKMGPIELLSYLKDLDYFPKRLLCIEFIDYSCDSCICRKKFFKIEVVQERLTGLAMISIENELLDTIPYEDLVDEFASKSIRRMTLFK